MPRIRTIVSAFTCSLVFLAVLSGVLPHAGLGSSSMALAAPVSHLEQHLRRLGIFDTAVFDLAEGIGISRKTAANFVGVQGFVDAIVHSPRYDPTIDNRVALAYEETAALLVIASKRTSMTFGREMIQDLYKGEVVIYQDLDELRKVCGDPDSFGCNPKTGAGGGSRSKVILYGYPGETVNVAMEKYRGELIHELMHNHQVGSDHPPLPSQFGGTKAFQDAVDENKACYDGVAKIMYRGMVPYDIVDLKLCKPKK